MKAPELSENTVLREVYIEGNQCSKEQSEGGCEAGDGVPFEQKNVRDELCGQSIRKRQIHSFLQYKLLHYNLVKKASES